MFHAAVYYRCMSMPELERLARLGDTSAQDEVERRSKKFATHSTHTCIKENVSKAEFMKDV